MQDRGWNEDVKLSKVELENSFERKLQLRQKL